MSFRRREPNVLNYFLHKDVVIEAENYETKGRLIRYELGNRETHKPLLLVLENAHGKVILRTWAVIKTRAKKLGREVKN